MTLATLGSILIVLGIAVLAVALTLPIAYAFRQRRSRVSA
jgi:ABC-type spermidine/putrescine transport system permease subunit II